MQRDHADEWLTDYLYGTDESSLHTANQALADAFRANRNGDTGLGKKRSATAIQEFERRAFNPGVLFSKFELTYAQALSGNADGCLNTLNSISNRVPNQYSWLQLQFQNEQAICLGMKSDLGKSSAVITNLLNDSRLTYFPVLKLRSLGIAASIETAKGNIARAWSLNLNGLAHYWNGDYPIVRAYQFYDGLSYGAESAGLNNLVLSIARESVAAISKTNDKPAEAMARYQLGKAALTVGMRDEAKIEFARADSIFHGREQNPDDDYYRADGQISVAKIETDRNDLTGAESRLSQLKSSVDASSNYWVKLRFYDAEGELALKKDAYRDAEAYFVKAAAIGEKGLSNLRTDSDRVAWDREVRNVYRELTDLSFNFHHDPEMALQTWEWYKSAALRAALVGLKPKNQAFRNDGFATLRDLLSSMPADLSPILRGMSRSTVISYATLQDQTIAWVFDNRGIESFVLPASKEQIEDVAKRFARECSDPNSDLPSLQKDGHELYDKMVKPLEKRLVPDRTLAVELDGDLSQTPVAALMDDLGNYLGERFRIVVSPGVLFTNILPSFPNTGKSLSVLSVGLEEVPSSSDLAPLPDAPNEARTVASQFPDAKILINEEATRQTIVYDLPGAQIFHFAGHAVPSPKGVILLLHDDQTGKNFIDSDQLNKNVLRHCVLAVLSACSTDGALGEGLVDPESLPRSFLRSGVPQVVATSWPVDSSTTTKFMGAFYAHVADGDTVVKALQRAAGVIRNTPATAHPYYWAPFNVFGRP